MMVTVLILVMMIMRIFCKKGVKRRIGSHGRTANELLNAPVVANKPLHAYYSLCIVSYTGHGYYKAQSSVHCKGAFCRTVQHWNILHWCVNLLHNVQKCMIQFSTAQMVEYTKCILYIAEWNSKQQEDWRDISRGSRKRLVGFNQKWAQACGHFLHQRHNWTSNSENRNLRIYKHIS